MKNKWIWAAMIVSIVMCACDKNNSSPEDSDFPFLKSYIYSYAELPAPSQVEIGTPLYKYEVKTGPDILPIPSSGTETWDYEDLFLTLGIKQDYSFVLYHELWGSAPYTSEDYASAAKFAELSKANGDLSYNRRGEGFGVCLYKRTESLHVISDAAYDAAHPAGTVLDDIMTVQFYSAEDYLKSGYRSFNKYLGKTTKPYVDQAGLVIQGPQMIESLAEFNQIKRTLMHFNFILRPTKAPDQTGTHRFTITYTNEDGVVLTGTTAPVTITKPIKQ